MGRCMRDDPILKAVDKPLNFEPDRIDCLIAAGVDKTYFIRGLGIRNPYGYEINISHPRVAPLYEAFKKKRNIPYWCPLGDVQRMIFEERVFSMLSKRAAEKKEVTARTNRPGKEKGA